MHTHLSPPRACPKASNAAHAFSLVSHWRIDAPLDRVWDALSHPEHWPQWWPYVRTVTPVRAGDADGLGAIRRFVWTSRLPYQLAFDVEVVELDQLRRIRGRASGQLDGEGVWELAPAAEATEVTYTWSVVLGSAWMRWIAPIAAPVFRWNHHGVMRAGAAGLRHHLTR